MTQRITPGEIKEFCAWMREWFANEQEEANQIKFGCQSSNKQPS